MGFNHCYVGNILQIQKELEDVGLEKFVKRYSSYEFISGDTESIDFIEQRVKLYEQYKKNIIINNDNIISM